MCEKKKEGRKLRMIGYVNEWSVNDRVSKLYQWRESRLLRCVLRGLNGGPRSLEHVRRRDTMNLSRVWVTLRASDYLFRLFSPVPLAGYALLFSPRLPTV